MSYHAFMRSRTGTGPDVLQIAYHGQRALASRALVGGVEYDSFFLNPLAVGSHEEGSPIPYSGASIAQAGTGLHNPLAEEFSDFDSQPASPSCGKVVAFASPHVWDYITAPSPPDTPWQGPTPIDDILADLQSQQQRKAHVSIQMQEQEEPLNTIAGSGALSDTQTEAEKGAAQESEAAQEPFAPRTPPLAVREDGMEKGGEEAGARQLLEQCGSAHVAQLGRFSLGAAGERSFSESLRRVQSLDGLRHSEGQTMERCEPLQLPLPICGAAQQQLECPQLLKSGEPLEEFQQKLQSPELLESPADAVQHREPAESPELLESQQLEGSQQQLKESQQQRGVSFEVVPTGCVEAPVSVCGRSVSSCGCPCTEASSCSCGAAMTSSRGSSLGGTNSRGSSLGGAANASIVANSRGSSLGGAADAAGGCWAIPNDHGCSISALAMTRALIRELGLIPSRAVAGRCSAGATQACAAGDAVAAAPASAGSCRAPKPSSQWHLDASSGIKGVHFDKIRLTGGGAPQPVEEAVVAPLCEEAAVEEAGAAPVREEAAASPPRNKQPAGGLPSEVDGEAVICTFDQYDSRVAARKTAEVAAEPSEAEARVADDDCSSIASTRVSSMVGADGRTFSIGSMQGWLEPHDWKPLRETFCSYRATA